MAKFIRSLTTAMLIPAAAFCWELSASVGYGACFLDGAPNAYSPSKPPAKTNEPSE